MQTHTHSNAHIQYTVHVHVHVSSHAIAVILIFYSSNTCVNFPSKHFCSIQISAKLFLQQIKEYSYDVHVLCREAQCEKSVLWFLHVHENVFVYERSCELYCRIRECWPNSFFKQHTDTHTQHYHQPRLGYHAVQYMHASGTSGPVPDGDGLATGRNIGTGTCICLPFKNARFFQCSCPSPA